MGEYLIPDVEAERAEQRAEGEARRLANLQPFEPGRSGNPAGRQTGGAFVSEEINRLLMLAEDGTGRTSREQLKAITRDKSAAPATVIAARQILLAMEDGRRYVVDRKGRRHFAGVEPECGRAFERILDRTVGKPAATLTVHRDESRSPEQIRESIAAMLAASPALASMLAAFMAGGGGGGMPAAESVRRELIEGQAVERPAEGEGSSS